MAIIKKEAAVAAAASRSTPKAPGAHPEMAG